MSITIRVWDLWVRLEKFVNLHLGKRVRRELVRRNEAYADAFLAKWRKNGNSVMFPAVYRDPAQKCSHMKGGRQRGIYKDYNLAAHTFADARTKIWCLYNCGLVAWNGDKNFANLAKMMEQSSNTRSASEIIAKDIRKNEITVTVQDRIPNG